MSKCRDLTGHLFERWRVVSRATNNKHNQSMWHCVCECGRLGVVAGLALRSGASKSCGCLSVEVATKRVFKHGMYGTPPYKAWQQAKDRATNPKNPRWDDYGGRGIKFCDEWDSSFETFWRDMGPTWKEGLSLDRRDVNGHYCKGNCRWATDGLQVHNRRKFIDCSSKYTGVSWTKDRESWHANINSNGIREYLGFFLSEHDAARAYDNRSEELYGDRPNGTENNKGEIKC